jgi:hypothetical protein
MVFPQRFSHVHRSSPNVAGHLFDSAAHTNRLMFAFVVRLTDHHFRCVVCWQGVVFCTFNRLGRITPGVFHAWTEILKRVPNSVIWLYKHPNTAVLRLLEAARKAGIDASRFCFAGPVRSRT